MQTVSKHVNAKLNLLRKTEFFMLSLKYTTDFYFELYIVHTGGYLRTEFDESVPKISV